MCSCTSCRLIPASSLYLRMHKLRTTASGSDSLCSTLGASLSLPKPHDSHHRESHLRFTQCAPAWAWPPHPAHGGTSAAAGPNNSRQRLRPSEQGMAAVRCHLGEAGQAQMGPHSGATLCYSKIQGIASHYMTTLSLNHFKEGKVVRYHHALGWVVIPVYCQVDGGFGAQRGVGWWVGSSCPWLCGFDCE